MISRSLLQWPPQAPAVQSTSGKAPAPGKAPTSDEAPIKILTVKSINPLDAQASVTDNSDDFESRWRARDPRLGVRLEDARSFQKSPVNLLLPGQRRRSACLAGVSVICRSCGLTPD